MLRADSWYGWCNVQEASCRAFQRHGPTKQPSNMTRYDKLLVLIDYFGILGTSMQKPFIIIVFFFVLESGGNGRLCSQLSPPRKTK